MKLRLQDFIHFVAKKIMREFRDVYNFLAVPLPSSPHSASPQATVVTTRVDAHTQAVLCISLTSAISLFAPNNIFPLLGLFPYLNKPSSNIAF